MQMKYIISSTVIGIFLQIIIYLSLVGFLSLKPIIEDFLFGFVV